MYSLIYNPLANSTPKQGSMVPAKSTTWCINLAEVAKQGQNRLIMGSLHLFVHT